MFFKSVNTINDASNMMDVLAQKQRALGENLANVDTPGYQRQDVDISQSGSKSFCGALEAEITKKFGPAPTFSDEDGYAGVVNPAHEIVEMQKNSILYTMATRQMSSIITQMKTVINVGK